MSSRRLHHLIEQAAASMPDTAAVCFEGTSLNFRQFASAIRHAARCVCASSSPGGRVAVLAWNRTEYLTLLYAVPAAGRIAVPLNARLAPTEIVSQLHEAGVEVLIGEADLLAPLRTLLADLPSLRARIAFGDEYQTWLDNAPDSHETDPYTDGDEDPDPHADETDTEVAWILFTSGTTGRPKGAMLTHASLLAALRSASDARPVETNDVFLYPFPLFHVSAHNVLIQHLHARTVVLVRSFDPPVVLDACRRYGVTTMSLAPTMIAMLLDHPTFSREALATVRTIGYGASSIAESLLRRVMAETDVGLSQGYGMTELSGSVSFLDPDGHRMAVTEKPQLLRSAGRPVEGIELRLVDDDLQDVAPGETGEIAVRAEQVIAGYWGQPELTAATIVGGWLRTGDLGCFDDEGYLYIVDRKKDMIITGGENVASREVEDVLLAHPAVREVSVVGVPDAYWGEAVTAVVSLRPGLAEPNETTADALVTHCRQLLASYKKPRHIVFVDTVPVNANGKYEKRIVRALAVERLALPTTET